MVELETIMIGDTPVYVCTGKQGCGALIRTGLAPEHVQFHLRIDGVVAAVGDPASRITVPVEVAL